ncbi:MAG: hypothetical protein Tsb0034_05420 [Ekhidna sp.]
MAERIGTGCQTVELTLTVNDDPLNVVIKSSPPSPQTSCDIGNGSIQVVADGLAMGGFSCNDCVGSDGFTFEWFFGGDDSNPLDNSFDPNLNVSFNADNTEVYGLVAGSYTVRVTEDATQCSNTQTIVINTDFDIPDPSAVATPNAVCDDAIAGAFNGTLTISGTDDGGAIDFSSGDYQITLFEGVGTGGASTVQTTNNVFDELENGSYTVVIENTTTGCTSNPETYNVGLNVTDFSGDINAAVSPQISCDLSNPLGEIVADVAGTTTGYTFQLFRSGTEILTNITDNSPTNITYSNLSSGNYRLVVTEQATGCDFDEDIEIQPNRVDPVFSNENTSDNERCNSPNGSVSFDIDAGGGADTRAGASYFAEIFEGSSITPSSTAIDDDTQTGPSASFSFGGLVEGDYIVRVTDQTTNCVSISSVFNVGYDGPVIEITPGAILEDLPADCFTDGGRIDISAAINIDNPGAETVEVIWYLGTDATPGQEISGMVGSGLFTNTTFSGAGTVSSTNPAGPVVATDLILDRIPAVNYTAVIRLSNGCEEQIVIDLPELAAPELTFTPGQPTNCDATNGSIQIDITTNAAIPGDVASNYQYTIHEGFYSVPPDLTAGTPYDPSLPDGTVRAFTNFTSATNMGSEIETNLDPGDYTVVVRRDPGSPLSADECPVGVFAFTLEAPPVPILGTPVVTDNTFCGDGADGGIEYNGMVEVTATYDGAPADFTFTLNEVNGAVYTPIPDGTNTFNGEDDFEVIYDPDTDNNGTDDDLTITGLAELPAGRLYAIIAEEVTSGCQDTVVFNLSNEPITNVLAGTEADIQDCVPGTGNFTVDTYPPSENESNYEFTWLDETGTPEAPVAGPGAGSRDYTAEGDYHVIARNLTNGCETQIDFSISNLSEVPEVAVNVSASDAFCTPNTGNGALEAVLIGGFNASDYIFEWYQGSSVDGDSLLANPEAGEGIDVTIDGYIIGGTNGEAITGLKEGEYTVNVTDNNGLNIGCFTTVVKSVPELQQIPTLTLSGIEVSPDSICGAGTSGQFIIDDADFTPGDVSDYTITVERNTVGSGILIASTASDATSVTYGNLDPGTYFITAIKDASGTPSENTGCSIAPVKVVVKDSTRNPQVALVSMTPNEDCGGGVNVGGLEILIDEKFDHTDHFDVQWYAGFDAVGGNEIGGENAVTLNGYPSGQYSVLVRNQHTDCEIFRNYTITNVPLNPSIQTYDVVDNNICDDDNDGTPVDVGSFELLTARFDGSPLNQAAMNGFYRLEVYDNLSDANAGNFGSAIADGDGDNTNFIYTELSAGTYFAIVRKLDSDCISEPTTFDIVDDVDRPIVSITLAQADENCGGIGTPNGALDAYASVGGVTGIDHTTNPAEYTFQWYYNGSAMADGVDPGNGSVPAGVATSSVSGLFADTYEVEFTRISTGCVVREEFILPIQEINVEILSVDTTAATNCVGNGIIEVTSVNRNTLSDYRFDFYDQDPTVGGPAPVFSVNGLATPAYNMAIGGTTYFIVGTNNILGCETPVFEIPVGENVAYPRRTESVQFEDQTNCDPSNPNGSLSIVIDNVVPAAPDYTVEWFFGDNTTNTLDDGDIGGFGTLNGETTATVSGLPSGEYTYRVTSTATGCSVSELLEVKDDIPNPLLLSPSSSPNTNCVNPDGILSVNIINRVDGHTYEYYWYAGTLADVGPSPNPLDADFTGSEVENLDDGTYVVFVVDQTDTFCQSNAIEVEVEDGTTPPMFDLETGNVTVCFDEKDGYALVSSPDISDYSFAWFDEGNNLIDTTLFVGSLDAGLYRIQATDRTTGCIASEVFEIFNDAVTPNDPFVVVNSGRDNCQINNGSAVANVDGVTSNYLFEWFDPANMNTPYATGSQVFNLDSITYLVRATDITTGCESGFTQISVPYEQVDPSFTVDVENSICLRTEDGATNQFTGTATIQFDEFNLATDYEWIFLATGEVVGTDSRLIDAFPGEYGVRFFAENGCDYYAEFSIETELNIYNGVSANGDGRNDFFLIDCVDYFPGNNVKIFNRAGQRVYEVDNYDNISVRFEGVSNVGGGGLILPPGTYFYLVDLGTGEDPIQGYLELVR